MNAIEMDNVLLCRTGRDQLSELLQRGKDRIVIVTWDRSVVR